MKILKRLTYIFFLTVSLSWFTNALHAERFNTGKLINTSGKKDVLGEDEGYLFISFNTLVDVSKLTLNRVGLGDHIKFTDIKEGTNYALLKVKAGDFYWKYIHIFFGSGVARTKLDSDQYLFKVKPGVINYPGTWFFSAEWVGNYIPQFELDNYNLLSYEIESFDRNFKKYSAIPFEYRGQVDDPYANYLANAKTQYPGSKTPDVFNQHDNDHDLPMTIIDDDFSLENELKAHPNLSGFVDYSTQYIQSVSPNGDYMLFNSSHADVIRVGLIDVDSYQTFFLYQQRLPKNTEVSSLKWVDNNTFFLTITNNKINRSYVAHLDINKEKNTISAKYIKFRKDGFLIDGLSNQENHLFFFADTKRGLKGNNSIFKVDVSNEKSIDESFRSIYSKTKKLKNIIDWLVDKDGEIRAVITAKYSDNDDGTEYNYWFLSDAQSNKWKKIKTTNGLSQLFWLQALSQDESFYYVLTDQFGDKNAVHKFSTTDGSHQGLAFEDPEQDIIRIIFNNNEQKIIGYTVVENGLSQDVYFDAIEDSELGALQSIEDLRLYKISEIKHKNRLLMFGTTPVSKGAWFMKNTQSGDVNKIFDLSPDYEVLPKGIHHLIKVKANDGVGLEGYLVMPTDDSGKKYPLVVIPHGGPIGVRDYANNDEMQHYFASQGVATLKVNYRGSSGFGKAFENLGKRQWGEKIEQDIYTVTDFVVKKYAINSKQICAMGGSYGGYSSMMLIHLYPEMFQCAVSMAGVMDLPLMFSSKDLSRNPSFYQKLTEVVGDPKTELKSLVDKSPLYLLDQIKKPFLLFHGMKDKRVRPEHAFRMQQMIQLNGQNNEIVFFEEEGHSFNRSSSVMYYLAKSLDFIKDSINK